MCRSHIARDTSKIRAMLVSLLAATTLIAPSKGLLLVDGLAIGRLQNGKWRNLVSKKTDPVGKERNFKFQVLGLNGVTGTQPASKLELMEDVADGWYASGEVYTNKVLWSGTPVKFPVMQQYSTSAKAYLDVVAAHLKSKKVTKGVPRIKKVVGVDLDGDGTREVIIEAAPHDNMVGRTMEDGDLGDYTAILIRWVKNGKPVTTVLEHHDALVDKVLGSADELRTIADFDGDGRFEIVISSDYYEGQSATVYSFRKGKVTKLVEYGAGV
jgi:hypothetical protein